MPEDQRCLRPLHYAKGCAYRVLLSCCLKLNFTRSHRELQPTTSFQSTGAASLANILWLRARAPVLFLHHSLLTSHHPHLPNPPSPSALSLALIDDQAQQIIKDAAGSGIKIRFGARS